MESYVSLGVEHSFSHAGRVRNILQCLTVQTESEVISMDAGLRMDGIQALDLWDVVIESIAF